MDNKKPLCFVIMGFGKKQDPSTGRMIDLDVTYKKIIQPAVLESNCRCVRADEIKDSGLIDKSMYALLYQADIVIADITTYNPNSLYELGVRHVLKPFSTIIIKEEDSNIPFDLDHIRILPYKHPTDIREIEVKATVNNLKSIIEEVCKNHLTDSPIYFIFNQKMTPPHISEEEIEVIVKALQENEETIYALRTKAEDLRKNERYSEAVQIWMRLIEKYGEEKYYLQQMALCRYKSQEPSSIVALTDALNIISKIKSADDAETLGITGAIYKNMYLLTKDVESLNLAIKCYGKGWNVLNDYYTGENLANCLRYKSTLTNGKEQIYNQVYEEKVRKNVIKIVLRNLENSQGTDRMWRFATLSNCYYGIGNIEEGKKYECEMMKMNPDKFAISTFNKTKEFILNS